MTPAQKILKRLRLKEPDAVESNATNNNDVTENSRRSFLKRSALGGVSLVIVHSSLLI